MTKLSHSLDVLWEEYGPGIHKHAATGYLYEATREVRDQEALTPEFCKLAEAFRCEPWAFADLVERDIESFRHLAKTAADQGQRRLAQFYVAWADDVEKRAGMSLLRGIAGAARGGWRARKGGIFRPSFKNLTSTGNVQPTMLQGMGRGYRKAVNKHTSRVAQGGGSAARGGRVAEQRAAQMQARKSAPVTQGPPPAAPKPNAGVTYAGAPQAAPTVSSRSGAVSYGPGPQTAPKLKPPAQRPASTGPAQPSTKPASQPAMAAATDKPPIDWKNLGLGAAGGLGVGAGLGAAMGAAGSPNPGPMY